MLAGASGGCYALVGAHFAIIVMVSCSKSCVLAVMHGTVQRRVLLLQNWKEMTHDWMQRGVCGLLMSGPVRLLIWSLFGESPRATTTTTKI